MRNPFPGLRPFEADEEHLFFGREADTDALVRRLRTSRFVAVVGTSGSGKSSLVRSGLIPALQGGFMSGAGSSWRIATLRPGEDPIGHLAQALSAPDVLGADAEIADTGAVLIDATLRRGTLGLVEAVRQARLPAGENVLVLVDQFEELFRFRRSRQLRHSHDEAIAFVKLLLEAATQQQLPIYIVITMRSDFIGDCMDFRGLPEAVNSGLYLVGRMTREGLRAAITGPVAVGGGSVAPRLVNRILNDLGDDHDQLPIVQHALMRTFDLWAAAGDGEPMDVDDYEAVGGTAHALSNHAEEAYTECQGSGLGRVAERMFKALTDTFADPRGIRRPTAVAELAAIADAAEADVIQVVEQFRRPGRSFLMPPAAVALTSSTIVDLAHESLMRCWDRLQGWSEEERAAAAFYARLSQAAAWHADGAAGLWRDPELELALQWRTATNPTAAWAARYDSGFDRAMAFLDASRQAAESAAAAAERARRQTLRRTQAIAAVLGVLLVAAVALAVVARQASARAEANLEIARTAVDESLASVERSSARVGADVPELEALRRELLEKARHFYEAFMQQSPRSEQSRRDLALAHLRLGHIHRLMAEPVDAEREYTDAIDRLERLVADYGAEEYRAALGSAYNWLGEVLRPQAARAADAERAYDAALRIQEPLAGSPGAAAARRQELARTLYNRGILHSERSGEAAAAEEDFRRAQAILQPLAADDRQSAQELARVFNNLGSLLSLDETRSDEVQPLWEQAIAIDERLLGEAPDSRELKFELATYAANIAGLLNETGERAEADRRSAQALRLFGELSRGAPSLAIAGADAHSLRGAVLRRTAPSAALREFAESLDRYAAMASDPVLAVRSDYNLRFGDLLLNLAALAGDQHDDESSRLLTRAVSTYLDVAAAAAQTPARREARTALETIARTLPQVREADRPAIERRIREVDDLLADAARRP